MGFELESGTATEEQQETQNQPKEKTFTQDEVNKIVSERLARDKGKNSAELEKREHELEQRELAMTAREKLAERGLPKELAEFLKFSDEKTLEAAINKINELKSEKPDGLQVLGDNRLPEHNAVEFKDNSLEKAFRLHGKE